MSEDAKFVFFSATGKGVVPRYGSTGYIGARYVRGVGYDVDTEKVVPIPVPVYRQNKRAYDRAVKDGALVEKTAGDREKYIERIAEEQKRIAEEQKKISGNESEGAGDSGSNESGGSKASKSSGGKK